MKWLMTNISQTKNQPMNTERSLSRRPEFLCRLLLSILLCHLCAGIGWSQSPTTPLLVKATDTNGASVIGELKSETEEQLELIDLKTGKKLTYQKSALNDFRKGITDREAATNLGLPEFLVWKIRRVIPGGSLSGKIAQIDSSIVYVTLSAQAGLEKGQELFVYRGDVPIKHPDTGEVLGMQRRRIAKLAVTEALDRLSKSKLTGDMEIELKVGDTVEPASQSKPIAILPLVDLNGDVRAGGKKLGEDLTTGLAQGGVSVVERTLLAKVLVELGLQNTKVFDSDKAQKIGKQLGAFAVLTGTMAASGYGSDVNLRLIRVETGEILFATRQNGPAPGPVVGFGQDTIIIESTTPGQAAAQPGIQVSGNNVVVPTPPPASQLAPRTSTSTPAIRAVPGNATLATAQGWKSLFNGRDLTGWKHLNPRSKIPCRVENGDIIGHGLMVATTDNICTEQRFWNFTFRCEFMLTREGRAQVYLRGRHSISILDDYDGPKLNRRGVSFGSSGQIYWLKGNPTPPLQPASRPAGQWQTLEATMIGNKVTVILNGKKVQDNVECNQISSGALDANLSAPGPIVLGWAHGGEPRFRNVMINELR